MRKLSFHKIIHDRLIEFYFSKKSDLLLNYSIISKLDGFHSHLQPQIFWCITADWKLLRQCVLSQNFWLRFFFVFIGRFNICCRIIGIWNYWRYIFSRLTVLFSAWESDLFTDTGNTLYAGSLSPDVDKAQYYFSLSINLCKNKDPQPKNCYIFTKINFRRKKFLKNIQYLNFSFDFEKCYYLLFSLLYLHSLCWWRNSLLCKENCNAQNFNNQFNNLISFYKYTHDCHCQAPCQYLVLFELSKFFCLSDTVNKFW